MRSARAIGVRNLADPIEVDSNRTGDPTAQLTVALLALFAQMEHTRHGSTLRTRTRSRRRRLGGGPRPVAVDPPKLEEAGICARAGTRVEARLTYRYR